MALGIATDTPSDLIAPVIKDADKKSLFDLAKVIAELARKARTARLALSDTEGESSSYRESESHVGRRARSSSHTR